MNNKLWGGRFKKKTHPLTEAFTSSIDVDHKLAEWDVIGSMIHTKVLAKAGLLSQKEKVKLLKGLDSILDTIKSNSFEYDEASEDIHTDIQNKLEKSAGAVALKLHTSRSRNDQIVFDVKMYCKEAINDLRKSTLGVLREMLDFAKRHKDIKIPGYTHLQHAQAVKLSEYIFAYCDMLVRDEKRLNNAYERIKVSLGSGALAGTPIKAGLYNDAAKEVMKELGLKSDDGSFSVVENSLDNVSDRDFVIEILSALAILGMHLSRLAEDFIIWSTTEFGFIEIGDEFCTGSSLMPQKKNPDVLELIRGYTGRLYGNLIFVLVTMKGLPLAYNRDMQLDKEPLFSSIEIVNKELKIAAELIKSIRINKDRINEQLKDESLYATDLADYLVSKGVPFKEAHTIIGKLIRYSIDNKVRIKEMPYSKLKAFSPLLYEKEVRKRIDPEFSVKAKKSVKARKIRIPKI